MNQPDLIVSGSYLLTGPQHQTVKVDHGLAISGDTISVIGPTALLHESYPEAQRLHKEGGVVMPGLINTHTHAAMSCFRGIADDLPLMTWLEEHIFPAEAKLTGETVFYATLLSMAEMIKSGTTSFCDMYLFAKEVARAADIAGMRAWIGEVLYDFPSPSYGELSSGYQYLKEMIEEYRHHPLVSITADPHAVYTCSPNLYRALQAIAEREHCLIHTHLSENAHEVATCKERYGLSPVHHLEQLGLLGANTLAAHCVVLDEEEIELLAKREVKVSHCLESNMKLASGTAPVTRMLEQGVTVALGTDGSASNNDVDMFGEMNSVAKVHKGILLDPTVMSAETTLAAATIGGARALGAEHLLGTLEPGKKADCIVLDFDQPHLTPCYNIPSHLVYAARGGDVCHSIINGRLVMVDRELKTIDETGVLAKVIEIAERMQQP